MASGRCSDVKGTIAELEWIAERGFVGTYAPGFVAYPHLPPLYDEFWEPVWAAYADLGLALVVHGGYGFAAGHHARGDRGRAYARVKAASGSDMDLVVDLTSGLFNDEGFFRDLRCRRAMWQMMLGGVFDRHPTLKLMMTEVRADWIPGDAAAARRALRGAPRRPPGEAAAERVLAAQLPRRSVVHAQGRGRDRHEIGVDTIDFGRDYPHTESTWPNTLDYWKIIFAGARQGRRAQDPRRERHPLLRPRPGAPGRRSPRASVPTSTRSPIRSGRSTRRWSSTWRCGAECSSPTRATTSRSGSHQ